MPTVREVCQFLQDLAPLSLAEDWDNVGLLLGEDTPEIRRLLTCLTLTSDVADEAVRSGVGMIVTHHPLLFKPVQKLNSSTHEGRLLMKLLRHGIAVYSAHTAYDNAASGINQQLAELLELTEIAPLRPCTGEDEFMLVVIVPESHLDPVRQAMWEAGCGMIGDYRRCSFSLNGQGTFLGSADSHPAIGLAGQMEYVNEVRVEVVCPATSLDRAVTEMRKVHPYEEPAIGVYPLKLLPRDSGAGRFGKLTQPITLRELNCLVADRLQQPGVQFVGDSSLVIERLGIACGSAAEFLRDAQRAGCQALLTGEARFHACLEARDRGMAMILPGHFATERPAMEELARRLAHHFPNLIATASATERDPLDLAFVTGKP